MVLDPLLRLISGWGDSEIHRSVDQTNTRPARAAGAFGDSKGLALALDKVSGRGSLRAPSLRGRFQARQHAISMSVVRGAAQFPCQTSDAWAAGPSPAATPLLRVVKHQA
jgi:hypothetical protein